jgi:hypothetical protein
LQLSGLPSGCYLSFRIFDFRIALYAMIDITMNFFSSANTSNNTVDALLDIRSGSVGAALVEYRENSTPKIHWSHRESVDFLTDHDTDRLLHMTQQALQKIIKQVREKGLPVCRQELDTQVSLGNVRCFFAAPWQVGSPQEITMTKDEKFAVDREQIELAKEKAEKLFSEDAMGKFGTESENLEQLTTAVFSIWCNGYEVTNPLGCKTDRLRIATYVSMLPSRVKKLTENKISDQLHPDKISLHSFTAAIQKTFTQVFSHPKTFLVVNVDEEMTQLLVVNSGVLMGAVSYPLGSNFLIRTLAKALNAPAADARTRLRQYQEDEANGKTQETVDRVIGKARTRWQDLLVSSLDEFSSDISVPDYAFVLANQATTDIFADFVDGVSVEKHLLSNDSFRIHAVTDELLSEHVIFDEHADHYLSMAGLVGDSSGGSITS